MENKRTPIIKTTWYQKWKALYNEEMGLVDKEVIQESKEQDTKQEKDKKIDKDFQTFEKFLKSELKKLKTKIKK